MDEKMVFKRNPDVVTRQIGDEVILLPLYQTEPDCNYIYTLNETAAAIWELIDGKNTLGQIKEELMNGFEVSERILEKELDTFTRDMKSIKAIL